MGKSLVPAGAAVAPNGVALATEDQLAEYVFINDGALDIIRENLGGQQMSIKDFERIKFPTGGNLSWQVSSLSGDPELVKSIDGIVVMYKNMRLYWENEFTGAGSPPDCQSNDMLTGRGNPGGVCATCPYAQWGSSPKGGDGQACKQVGALFIIKPGELVPSILPVPPTSQTVIKKFMLNLASKKIRHSDAILGFGLEQDKNKGGITYSKIKPRFIAALPEAAKTQISAFVEEFRKGITAVTLTKEDISGAE